MREGRQEVLIERPVGRAVDRMAAGAVRGEAGTLLGHVGEFHEGIGEFDAADEQLEPLGHARVGGIAPRQRRLGGRPVGKKGRPRAPQMRLDAAEEQAEKQILPALARTERDPGAGSQLSRTVCAGEQVDAHVPRERLGNPHLLAPGEVGRYASARNHRGQHRAQERVRLGDQIGKGRTRAVPFEHGEFGAVKRPGLAVAPHPRELEDAPGPAGQQLLHREFRARVQPARVARPVRIDPLGGEGAQMHLLSRRRHGVGRFNLDIAARLEERAHGPREQRAAAQAGQAGGERVGMPGGLRHDAAETTRAAMQAGTQTLRDADALCDAGLAAPAMRDAIAVVGARYAIAIPPVLARLIERADDPLGLQFVPDPAELVTAPHETADPISDEALSPIKGIVHRYPDRALLKPLLICPVYCRFCFRREQVGRGVLSAAELAAAYDWLRAHPAIREVILTGGDPLLLSPRRLRAILDALAAIPHVETLRVHSRVPIANPARLNDGMAEALATEKPLWLVVHANHAREFSEAARTALRRVQRRGVPTLGQSVLLRGVNDSAEALEDLFRAMLAARVKPYYLHQLDPAPGTARFAVPIEEGRRLMAALRGRVTGLALPTYVLDRPGGEGKVPIATAAHV
jgi:lysine 2,3-aminomutase